MKFEISNSKLEQVIIKYLENKNFIIRETPSDYFFLLREDDDISQICVNKDVMECWIHPELRNDIQDFFSTSWVNSENAIFRYVSNVLNLKLNGVYTIGGYGTYFRLSVPTYLNELYDPSGKVYKPKKLVVHKSNPIWRENIELKGLQTSVGDCYQQHVGGDVECRPSIFATDSLKKYEMFDSTYDDDIWVIDTKCAGVTWYSDIHFEHGDYPHIVTFENISPNCLKLIHKGTGKSY